MSNDWVYDIETFPNVFTIALEHVDCGLRAAFEISDWRNDSRDIVEFLQYLKETNARMVGFNNIGFDYPVIHTLIRMGHSDANTLYQKAMAIIHSQDGDDRWVHGVRVSEHFISQLDLFKIHHFDNRARSTSLKALEFNMRADSIQDLPFPVGTVLTTREQVDTLKRYNAHDVAQTKVFYHHSKDMIRFREDLTRKYRRDFMNHNDTKIGKDYFIMKLEEAGVPCYDYGPSGRTPRQTKRPSIALKDAILPWIEFEQPEFTRVLNWLKDQTITETKGVFTDLTATVNGLTFTFGLGGIHASVENAVIESDDEYIIEDIDVEAYYPSTAIAQRFKPAHFPDVFCDIYAGLKEQRKHHVKGSSENAMLKLANNGVYGDSNSPFSVFYDSMFTMKITLNGQLLICKLVEWLMVVPDLIVIQANTDGLTLRYPRFLKHAVKSIIEQWEKLTYLKMESSEYKRMFIRDVNSYIAEYTNGKRKLKGAYLHQVAWHQDAGSLVIPKVAEKVLLEDAPIRETVMNWPDIMDFMSRAKVQRSSHLVIEHAGTPPEKIQNTTRYYIAKDGGHLFKWMPPLKGRDEWRRIGIQSGWGVQVCNDIKDAGKLPIDFDYYVREVEKLCLGLA